MFSQQYYLIVFILSWSIIEPLPEEGKELPTPHIYGISSGDSGSTILWLIDEKTENVLGYKVKLWQVGCDKKPRYTYMDGELVRLKNIMPRLRDSSTLRNLTEFVLEGVDKSQLLLKDIEHDVPYQVTVTAYGAGGDEGSPSNPFRFQYRGRYTCREI